MRSRVIYFLVSFTFAGLLYSCNTETEPGEEGALISSDSSEPTKKMDILFDESQFSDTVMVSLLEELQMCSDKNQGPTDYSHPSCTPDFFHFDTLNKSIPLKDGFILMVKAKVNDFPLRRVLVFERENGKLVKVNGFVANLIGRRESKTGYDDLYLRFTNRDGDELMYFNCYYTWNNGKYSYSSAEVIEGVNWGGKIKTAVKDSVSKEVEKDILKNKMVF
jgi:hypothetical protein